MLVSMCTTCCYAVSLTTFQPAKPPDPAMELLLNNNICSTLNLTIDHTLANDAAEHTADSRRKLSIFPQVSGWPQ
jgi:hypothetical protein